MDNRMNANKKKKVSYRLIRLFMIYSGFPLVGMFYYILSEALFSVFIWPTVNNFEKIYQAFTVFLMIPLPLFLMFLFAYLLVQLIIYSIVMEFIVLPWVKSKYCMIFLSGVMCSLFPLFNWKGIALNNIYEAGINLCLIGFISGIFIGYMLYCSYRKQLEKNQ